MLKNERKNLRTSILSKRNVLTHQEKQHASDLISKQLSGKLFFLRSKRIAFYFANGGEVDTSRLLEKALSLGKECYLPILHPTKQNQMWFGRYEPGNALDKNRYGILEPCPTTSSLISPRDLDLVITPLVAFDDKGNRLGMGGGFYDRTFSFLLEEKRGKPKLVGLAYEFQHVPEIDTHPNDVPLDIVFTENAIYSFEKT